MSLVRCRVMTLPLLLVCLGCSAGDTLPANDVVEATDTAVAASDSGPADVETNIPTEDVPNATDAQEPDVADASEDLQPPPPDVPNPTLPATSEVEIVEWIAAYIDDLPGKGSEGYVAPSPAERAAFGLAVQHLVAGEWDAAAVQATAAGAALVHLSDGNAEFVGLVDDPSLPATGRGRYLVRIGDAREVLIASPHPRFDLFTGLRAAELFVGLQARAFAVAGAHRCANAAESGCSGKTGACGGGLAPYRVSDQAHTEGGSFQAFHESLGVPLAVQIHGFGSGDDEPEFTISDGTKTDSDDPDHLGNRVAGALAAAVAAAGSTKAGNSCNRTGDINLLCASSNTQGRWLNGVPVSLACTTAATQATGAFLHLELSKDLRAPGGLLEPSMVLDALLAELPGP